MRTLIAWCVLLAVGLVVQTALLPFLLADPWRPDVTRSLVLWLALTGVPRGGLVLAFGAGLALDLAAGAPLGTGAVLRLVLYGVARLFRGVFFEDHPFLLLPFAALGPLLEAGVLRFLGWLVYGQPPPAAALLAIAWRQSLVEAAVVPVAFVFLELASGRRAPREVQA